MTEPRFDPQVQERTVAGGQQLIARFSDYASAQALVDRMSDDGFPVEHVRIIGDGVRTVEQVTGRMTVAKAGLGGSATGAWFGLLVGLLLGLFANTTAAWLWILVVGLVLGAFWGAIFGALAHWVTRGERDFSSVMTLKAQRYDVYVDPAHAARAARYGAEQP